MKVMITKCSDPLDYWYEDDVGQIFEVGKLIREKDGDTWLPVIENGVVQEFGFDPSDCEIIELAPHELHGKYFAVYQPAIEACVGKCLGVDVESFASGDIRANNYDWDEYYIEITEEEFRNPELNQFPNRPLLEAKVVTKVSLVKEGAKSK